MSERIDEIGFGNLKLIQETDDFCYGIDAVLLADFAKLSKEDTVCDLGCGNGIVPIILNHKYSPVHITGLEFQLPPFKLAERNVELNGLSSKISVVNGDVLDIKKIFDAGSFTAVTSNPPYTKKGSGPIGSNPVKHAARHETTASLEDFIKAASYLLSLKGTFTMVHRPSRLVDIFTLMRKYDLEPKRMQLVTPHPGEEANIVLVQAVKGGNAELKTEPTLSVRDNAGSYSLDINSIYERS